MKAVIFPYDEKSEPLVRYSDLLGNISIKTLLTPTGFGLNGVSVTGNGIEYIIQSEIQTSDIDVMDVLLIVESYHKVEFELILEQVKKVATYGKEIILARELASDELAEIIRICEENKVKLTLKEEKTAFRATSDFKGLADIHTPIIAVMGNGTRCSKFELQMEIKKQLLAKEYKVCSVSSRSNCIFPEIYSYPKFMQESALDEHEKIINYNRFIKFLEDTEQPEIIIIGIPGGLMPLTKQKPGDFGISAYEVLSAVEPDFTVMSLYVNDYQEEYFDEMNRLLHYRFNTDADCFNISNVSLDKFSMGSVLPTKYLRHKDSKIREQCGRYKHKVYCRSTYAQMGDFLVETLGGYDETKVM